MLEQSSHPRSLRAKDSVLASTELLTEGGLPAATVDAISARSGVSKATIYKHWPSRTAIAAEAFGKQMAEAIPLPDTGAAVGDLPEQVRRVSDFYSRGHGQVFGQLLAASVTGPEASPYFRDFLLDAREQPSPSFGSGSLAARADPRSAPRPPRTSCSARSSSAS